MVQMPRTDPILLAKGPWTAVLTSTPVIMTMLATALAGLSSSEMTQAQYHRSLAAQHQSRAGDQWAFFQAKRMRSSLLENAADILQPVTGMLNEAGLTEAVQRVTSGLQQAAEDAKQLEEKWKSSSPSAPAELRERAKQQAEAATKYEGRLHQELAKPAVKRAFTFLATRELPVVEENRVANAELERDLRRPWDGPAPPGEVFRSRKTRRVGS